MSDNATYIGEIIENTASKFMATAKDYHQLPAVGSFVKITLGPINIYGVTTSLAAGGDDNRMMMALGMPLDELVTKQPQIADVLTFQFAGELIGFSENGVYKGYLTNQPILHSFVKMSNEDEISLIAQDMNFLNTLVHAKDINNIEILAAVLRTLYRIKGEGSVGYDYLVCAGKKILSLSGYDRGLINSIFAKVDAQRR